MRGRLIFPYFADIAQLDTVATAAVDPDAGGPKTSGYDDVFREPEPVQDPTFSPLRPAGGCARQETIISIPVQVDHRTQQYDRHQMLAGGDQRGARMVLWTHFAHLEEAGLLDAHTNAASIRVNDRLVALYQCVEGAKGPLIQSFPAPHHDLRLWEVSPRGMGLSGLARNLLKMTFEDREQATRR